MLKLHVSDIFMLENLFCLVINEFFYLCNQYTYIHRYLLFIELEGTVGVKPTYQDFADPDLIRSDTCPIIIYFHYRLLSNPLTNRSYAGVFFSSKPKN